MKTYICIVCLVAVVSAADPDAERATKLSKGSNRFSQNLYQQTALNDSNSIFSPLSIHQALSLTSLGARQETNSELSRVLGLNAIPGDSNQPHETYKYINEQLINATDVEVLTANAMFVNPSLTIESPFIASARNYYQAEVSNFDLSAPGGPEKNINDFVSNKTKGLIKNLLQSGTIDASTVLALINTLFFNGTWQKHFLTSRTQKSDFHTPNGIVQLDTMFDERSINLKRNFYDADVGELVFRGGRFSFVILLSRTANGSSDQEKSLTIPGRIESLFQGLTPTQVKLSLPKFKLESTYELNTPLKSLGIVKAFSPGQANFTGISSAGGIYISKVLHKAVIDVTETGTVAAAATAVILSRTAAVQPPTETFYVKYPFLYFLYDRQLELIVFQGKFSG
ncbi:hypothetical protein BsWGS_21474 [Bradybaena similaris]